MSNLGNSDDHTIPHIIPKAISHVKAWQGKPQTNIWSLLVQIWQQEEFDLEVPRDVMNTVAGECT